MPINITIEEQIAWDNHRMEVMNAFSKPLSETDPELWQRCVDKATQNLADTIDREIVELYNANEHP